jgi:hypothetical protein
VVRSSPVEDVTVTIDGVTHIGKYYTHGPVVYVHYKDGRKEARIGDSPPELVAKLLLLELVEDGISNY